MAYLNDPKIRLFMIVILVFLSFVISFLGNCSVITNSSVCVEGLPGLWCVWDLNSETCVSANSVPEVATNHSTCPLDEGK